MKLLIVDNFIAIQITNNNHLTSQILFHMDSRNLQNSNPSGKPSIPSYAPQFTDPYLGNMQNHTNNPYLSLPFNNNIPINQHILDNGLENQYQNNPNIPLTQSLPINFQDPIDYQPVADKSESDSSKIKEKNEVRLYKCAKCDKSYMSYPALYTHTKLKHMKPGETPSITNGRMRGRPKKRKVIIC